MIAICDVVCGCGHSVSRNVGYESLLRISGCLKISLPCTYREAHDQQPTADFARVGEGKSPRLSAVSNYDEQVVAQRAARGRRCAWNSLKTSVQGPGMFVRRPQTRMRASATTWRG